MSMRLGSQNATSSQMGPVDTLEMTFSHVATCGKIQRLRGLRALIPVRVSLFLGFERFVVNLCVDQGLFRSLTSYIVDQRPIANCSLKQCCFATTEQVNVSLSILTLMFATSCSKGAALRVHSRFP